MERPVPDARERLNQTVPRGVPERIAELASEQVGCPVAVYVLDVEGNFAMRLAGDPESFPVRIRTSVGVGPEVIPEALGQLRDLVGDAVRPSRLWPMTVRDRVMGFLLAHGEPSQDLDEFAAQAGVALEVISGYTDVVHAVRRRRETTPAAEIQQNLLPPRLAHLEGADVAGGVLPGYDAGGDFFDYASNADGLWLTVADGAGKGNSAAALASLAIGAMRSARRAGAGLQETARLTHEAILALDTGRYLTAVIASWSPIDAHLRWVNCGHLNPLRITPDGTVEELGGDHSYPLGMRLAGRSFPVLEAPVRPGDRLLLYSDGLSERPTGEGRRVGDAGLRAMIAELGNCSAAMTVRGLQDAVVGASAEPLRDDATLLVVAPYA